MQKTNILIDLSGFTPSELLKIEAAAEAKKMTIEQFVLFLLQGVQTPK